MHAYAKLFFSEESYSMEKNLGRRLLFLLLLLLLEKRWRSQALLLLVLFGAEDRVGVGGPASVGLALGEGAVAVRLLVVRVLA